jgi:hypothetical protein
MTAGQVTVLFIHAMPCTALPFRGGYQGVGQGFPRV